MGIPRTAAPCKCQSMRSSCCGSPSCPACLHIPSASPNASVACSRPFCSQISVEARIQISIEQSACLVIQILCCANTVHAYSSTVAFGMGMKVASTSGCRRRIRTFGRRRSGVTKSGTRKSNDNWQRWDGTVSQCGNAS